MNTIDFNNLDMSKLNLNTSNLGLDTLPLSEEHKSMLENVTALLNSNTLQNSIQCDAECRKNKKEQGLYNEYIQAKNTYTNAPENLEDTERKFYSFSKGGAWYMNFKEKEEEKNADAMIQLLKSDFETNLQKIRLLISQNRDRENYNTKLNELLKSYEEKIKNAQKTHDRIENSSNIANRETIYDVETIQTYSSIHTYTYIFVILLFIAYCIYILGVKKIYTRKQFIFVVLFSIVLWNIGNMSEFVVRVYEKYTKITSPLCELEEYKEL